MHSGDIRDDLILAPLPRIDDMNVDKYAPKQDPGGWLTIYTTAARAAGATEDVMTAYLPIILGQDAL